MSINIKKGLAIVVLILASFMIGYFGSYECVKLSKQKELAILEEEYWNEDKVDVDELREYTEILKEYRDMLEDKDSISKEKLNTLREKRAQLESRE